MVVTGRNMATGQKMKKMWKRFPMSQNLFYDSATTLNPKLSWDINKMSLPGAKAMRIYLKHDS